MGKLWKHGVSMTSEWLLPLCSLGKGEKMDDADLISDGGIERMKYGCCLGKYPILIGGFALCGGVSTTVTWSAYSTVGTRAGTL